jgi:hypothetical protein
MKRKTLKFRVEISKEQAKGIINYLADRGKHSYISKFELTQLQTGNVELIITRERIIENEIKHFHRDIVDLMYYSGRAEMY